MSLQQTWATATGVEVRLIVNTPGQVRSRTYDVDVPRVIFAIEELVASIDKDGKP